MGKRSDAEEDLKRALGLRTEPQPDLPEDDPRRQGVPREQLRQFEQHLRRELERDLIERTKSLPPKRPLNELDRTLPTGPIQDLAAAGTLRHIVVIGLGTNGDVTAGQIRQLRQVIGPNRDLVLVNTFGPMPWEHEVNAELDAAARQGGNVELANWNKAIAADPSLLWPDGIHPQPSGAKLYARVVLAAARAALSRAQPSSCPKPH